MCNIIRPLSRLAAAAAHPTTHCIPQYSVRVLTLARVILVLFFFRARAIPSTKRLALVGPFHAKIYVCNFSSPIVSAKCRRCRCSSFVCSATFSSQTFFSSLSQFLSSISTGDLQCSLRSAVCVCVFVRITPIGRHADVRAYCGSKQITCMFCSGVTAAPPFRVLRMRKTQMRNVHGCPAPAKTTTRNETTITIDNVVVQQTAVGFFFLSLVAASSAAAAADGTGVGVWPTLARKSGKAKRKHREIKIVLHFSVASFLTV